MTGTRVRRTLATAVAAIGLALVAAPGVGAQDFGFNTTAAAPNYPYTCAHGIPILRSGIAVGAPPFIVGSSGFGSCTWTSISPTAGLYPPGRGTVTSVQLPALQAPGPMQVVVLATERINGASTGLPTLVCCQFVRASQVFTPPANTPSNITVNLPVEGSGAATATPGESQAGQVLALQMLSPNAQLPVVDLGDDNSNFYSPIWIPAFNGQSREFIQPTSAAGYVLLMSATFVPAGGGGGGGTDGGGTGTTGGGGTGTAITPQSLGLSLTGSPDANSRGVASLGSVSNPPTQRTEQFIRLAGKSQNLATGKTTVSPGGKKKMTVKLTKAGKKALKKKRSVKANLTVVATDNFGLQSSYTRRITLRR